MNKQIKILVLIFISLLFAIVWTQWPENKKDTFFFNFNQEKVASFQINYFTTGLHFKKDQGRWLIRETLPPLAQKIEIKEGKDLFKEQKDYQVANSQEVSKAITYLLSLKNLKPISTTTTQNAVFQINPHSLHVVLFDKDNKELDRIYIGKSGPDPMTSFIKRKEPPEVYLANQDFRLLFFRTKEQWIKPLKLQKKMTNQDS